MPRTGDDDESVDKQTKHTHSIRVFNMHASVPTVAMDSQNTKCSKYRGIGSSYHCLVSRVSVERMYQVIGVLSTSSRIVYPNRRSRWFSSGVNAMSCPNQKGGNDWWRVTRLIPADFTRSSWSASETYRVLCTLDATVNVGRTDPAG